MTWFKVDDGLASHRKVLSIPRKDRPAAMGLWVLAGSWVARNLNDGVVPAYVVEELGCTHRMAEALVSSGLWSREAQAYLFHGWTEPGRQPTRVEVEARREQLRLAGIAGGKASGASRREAKTKHDASADTKHDASEPLNPAEFNSRPVPSRPSVLEVEGHPQVVTPSAVTMIQQRMNTSPTTAASVARTIQERFNPRDLEKYLTRIPDDELRKLLPTTGNQPPKIHELCDIHGRHRDYCPDCKAEAATG